MEIFKNSPPGYVSVHFDNGNVSEHELSGVLFLQRLRQISGGRNRTTYYNVFGESSQISQEQLIFEIRNGIEHGMWSKDAKYVLIRYGESKRFLYFPIPLLFESDEDIIRSSKEKGLEVHNPSWYRRKRNLILKIVGLPLIP